MDKIASPQELVKELRSLLAYSESESPSREKLASDLQALADRTAAAPKLPGSKEYNSAVLDLIKAFKIMYPDVPSIAASVEEAVRKVSGVIRAKQQKIKVVW
jgi:hypothetical protein